MPELLTDPMHWHLRAEEARRLAEGLKDPEARAAKREMADKYERLAARARAWMNRGDVPAFIKSPPTAADKSDSAK
jgi:hypothetical protein